MEETNKICRNNFANDGQNMYKEIVTVIEPK